MDINVFYSILNVFYSYALNRPCISNMATWVHIYSVQRRTSLHPMYSAHETFQQLRHRSWRNIRRY